jgi:hypothetical protein
MNDYYAEYMKKQQTRSKLEKKLDEYNHTMELVRTILPIIIIVLQVIILGKIV